VTSAGQVRRVYAMAAGAAFNAGLLLALARSVLPAVSQSQSRPRVRFV